MYLQIMKLVHVSQIILLAVNKPHDTDKSKMNKLM